MNTNDNNYPVNVFPLHVVLLNQMDAVSILLIKIRFSANSHLLPAVLPQLATVRAVAHLKKTFKVYRLL